MNLELQNTLVLLAIFGAFAYLARGLWHKFIRRSANGCGACSHCAPSADKQEVAVFAIGERRDVTTRLAD
jgi:hypothetical protein